MHTRIFQAISTFLSASMNMANSRTKTFPLGMPLPSIMDSLKRHGECISVISFNLLAPLYVRPIDKRTGKVQPFAAFEWVKDDSLLEWPLRKSRLLDALRTCRAQVICVQELQLERSNSDQQASFQIPTWLSPMVEKCGYEAILPPSDQLELIAERNVRVLDADVAVTCAVLVQSKHWNIVTESRDHKKDDTASTVNSNTCVSVCLENKENATIDPIVVTSVHLDATDEQKRIRQLSKCFERANFLLHSAIKSKEQQQQQQKHASNNDEKKSTIVPLTAIIAGDMNAEFQRGSCMHSILQNKRPSNDDDTQKACAEALRLSSLSSPTPKQLEEWKELQIEASQLLDDYCVSLDRVDTGATRCAYSHDEDNKDNDDDVSVPAMESWKLDHILYTTSRLTPLARWSTLESDDESSSIGLPSQNCPSDHLPIAAVFELLPKNVQLDPSTKKETLYQIVQLSITHQKALENIDMIMEAKQKAILKQLADTKGDDIPEQTVSKKKKLKKRPPPQEIIDLIREKRALIKDLKHQQQCEREQLVKNFSQLQRLVVQEHFGMSWKEWAKSGS
mmetsp:Transcript_31550/g.46565  ORF Transcript_31550/g.46565 Transcript_31550/m.46565 type:complete len:564 (-) Transcript_31550:260-1951(-)|eukprot:CAMPEP_0194229854 /NCGR_PEP_ID=MMETSP0156-20130528/44106_1 /TAXON_ID=33649 /ORGANISM="Thalassionema nitzschioides, Strain L26-B" /LENGTH=563 /DNA_ID=CAMNT_0038962417 /DNA_START=1 /DNA_END=1692 /DNA_ORIENTATION=+